VTLDHCHSHAEHEASGRSSPCQHTVWTPINLMFSSTETKRSDWAQTNTQTNKYLLFKTTL